MSDPTADTKGDNTARAPAATLAVGEPFEVYAADPGINASAIVAGSRSMLHMRYAMTGGAKDDTAAMSLGRLAHCAILEPRRFAEVASVFDGVRRGKKWDEHTAEHDAEWTCSPAQYDALSGMRDAVWNNEDAASLLDCLRTEVSCYLDHEDHGRCKCRFDALSRRHGIIELKTTAEVSEDMRRFRASAYNLRYDLRLAWYWMLGWRIDRRELPITVIVVESRPPHAVAVMPVPEPMLHGALEEVDAIVRRYRISEQQDSFAGPVTQRIPFALPDWACKEEVNMEGCE